MITKCKSKILILLVSTVIIVSFVSCNGVSFMFDDPQTPILQEVRLRGAPNCAGQCSLPTTSATSWVLSPSQYVNQYGRSSANIRAIVVVDTPAITDLSLSYTLQGQTHDMQEIPRTAGVPGIPDHYRIESVIFAGKKLRWTVMVASSACANPITFHFVNVGKKPGKPKSAALDVSFRRGSYIACEREGGAFFNIFGRSGSPSPSSPSTQSGSSSCPSGTRLFRICQNCQASVGQTPIYFYSEGCYSSWQNVKDIYSTSCMLTQVSGPSNCELP